MNRAEEQSSLDRSIPAELRRLALSVDRLDVDDLRSHLRLFARLGVSERSLVAATRLGLNDVRRALAR